MCLQKERKEKAIGFLIRDICGMCHCYGNLIRVSMASLAILVGVGWHY